MQVVVDLGAGEALVGARAGALPNDQLAELAFLRKVLKKRVPEGDGRRLHLSPTQDLFPAPTSERVVRLEAFPKRVSVVTEPCSHRLSAALRQPDVLVAIALRVGVPNDLDIEERVGCEQRGHFLQCGQERRFRKATLAREASVGAGRSDAERSEVKVSNGLGVTFPFLYIRFLLT